ncbi:MAG TPA: winged helix DNA-binding domain-containing protein [Streptosporangiaceae bacterium]|nr:winged helix DNA-binding domain-containing protein [Streptosporangiaceae bacterium]
MSASDVLTHRELNRALLARQLLLEPDTGRDALAAVEHLVGMQAQAPFPPYYGLWSRLDRFRPDDLATLISTRSVVRIALMRGTIHLVSARDCLPLRAIVQPVLDRAFRTNQYKRLTGVDLAELAVRGRELVDAEPMTFSELGKALAQRWPGNPPADLAQGVRALVPLVQVPPRAVWGQAGVPRHTSAEAWLGLPPVPDPAVPGGAGVLGGAAVLNHAALVRRYLAAFGPATVRDIQAWSGLTGLRAAVEELRAMLVTFRDEAGAELFDLPDAPRPAGGTPAPVRLVAEFDNLVLSHADRTRIFAGVDMARMYSINGIVPGSVLVDGFVAGLWRIVTARKTATLTIELWEDVTDRRTITGEAERLLAFAAPGATHDIRFQPLW